MKHLFVTILFALIISCNNHSGKQNEEQRKIDSLTNELNKRDDEKRKQDEVKLLAEERNSVLDKVTTDKASFIAYDMGGLKDIRFTLFNDYKYRLEQVLLTVHYVKRNGTDAKKETVMLHDIEPGSRKAVTAPDYIPAGKDIKVTIESVLCKTIDLCYYAKGDNNSAQARNSNDPYKCK